MCVGQLYFFHCIMLFVSWTNLRKISGITSKNGRNDAKRLNIRVVTMSNDDKPKNRKTQRRADLRRNERLATVNPYWRGNPMVRGRFFNRQNRFRPGMGSVLKWRLSPNPQRKEKKAVKWDPKVCYLRSLDAVVGDSLIWLGHNSFFLQLAGKRVMFDPVFGNIPFVKRQSIIRSTEQIGNLTKMAGIPCITTIIK